jgi:3-oxoacyl-[acyl-carrier-protein] synthase-1
MPEWETLGLTSRVAGAIVNFRTKLEQSRIPKKLLFATSDASLYCCVAALDAVRDSGLDEIDVQSDRTACIVGTELAVWNRSTGDSKSIPGKLPSSTHLPR